MKKILFILFILLSSPVFARGGHGSGGSGNSDGLTDCVFAIMVLLVLGYAFSGALVPTDAEFQKKLEDIRKKQNP